MLDEIRRPMQLITAKLGGSSEFRDRNHRLNEAHWDHDSFFVFHCVGFFLPVDSRWKRATYISVSSERRKVI